MAKAKINSAPDNVAQCFTKEQFSQMLDTHFENHPDSDITYLAACTELAEIHGLDQAYVATLLDDRILSYIRQDAQRAHYRSIPAMTTSKRALPV